MLKGYRSIVVALVGLAAIGGGVGFGLLQQSRYVQEAEHRRTDYARHAADQIRQGCASIAPPQQAQCLVDAVDEYAIKARDNQREYDDLVAQRKSALWTSIMGVAALLGMFLSAVGVLLVWTTFRETKRTNQIAMRENARSTRRALASGHESATALAIAQRNADAAARQVEVAQETAKRQLRAYISVVSISQMKPPTVGEAFSSKVKFVNHGRTPAHNVVVQAVVIAQRLPHSGDGFTFINDPTLAASTQGPTVDFNAIVKANEPLGEELHALLTNGGAAVFCIGLIRYQDAFGETHVTGFRMVRDESGVFNHCQGGNEAD